MTTKLKAAGFNDRHDLSYSENVAWAAARGVVAPSLSDEEFRQWFREVLAGLLAEDVLGIDTSSLNRRRTAIVIEEVVVRPRCKVVHLLYAPARYSGKAPDSAPMVVWEPVTPFFAGWSSKPERPATLVLGLGYEADRAVGVQEYFEPEGTWAFMPKGVDPRYDKAMNTANRRLWDVVPHERRLAFDVLAPFGLYHRLESLLYTLQDGRRVVVVPFGPKIFALASMLIALQHGRDTGVWRGSGGAAERPKQREAMGAIIGYGVHL